MIKEKNFEKYKTRGVDYHWKQINLFNISTFNAFVYARYTFLANQIKMLHNYPGKIIDFGCGDGVQLYVIKKVLNKKAPSKLYGIDLSEKALQIANQKVGGQFLISNVYKTSFDDNFFDIAISSDVIEHVKDASRMIDEMIRVTKPGGLIMIGTPIKFTEKPLDSMHEKEYFQEEFKSLFLNKAVEIFDYFETHPLIFYLLYRKYVSIFKKKLLIFRYAINLLAILFNWNLFLTINKKSQASMIYQFIILKKN